MCLSVCLSVPNRLLNHAPQRDDTLHKGVYTSGEGMATIENLFECDLQSNSEELLK